MSKLKYIKIILGLLLKSYLIYLWVNFVGAFTHLLYYIYILKVFSLEDFGLFLFFLFGNIVVFCGLFYGVSDYRRLLINPKYIMKLKTGFDLRKKKHLSIKFYLVVYCFC